jgi:hypothetical protein
MAGPAFDAANYVQFDLQAGAIRSRDDDALVLIPRELLAALSLGDELDRSARAIGETRGKRFAAWASARSGQEPLPLDALADGVDGALAVLGFGRTEIEIRGDALLFKVKGAAKGASKASAAFLGGFLGGYLSALDPEVRFDAVHLGPSAGGPEEAVFLAGSAESVRRVAQWISGGADPVTAIERLHREGGKP